MWLRGLVKQNIICEYEQYSILRDTLSDIGLSYCLVISSTHKTYYERLVHALIYTHHAVTHYLKNLVVPNTWLQTQIQCSLIKKRLLHCSCQYRVSHYYSLICTVKTNCTSTYKEHCYMTTTQNRMRQYGYIGSMLTYKGFVCLLVTIHE